MIPLNEINNLAARLNVPIDTVEKDYIISWLLICLSRSALSKDFIFYGGTAIKRIYFDDQRFSEDVDLISHKNFKVDHILSEMEALNYAQEAANISLKVNLDTVKEAKGRIQLHVNYSGFDEIIGSPKQVQVDLAMGRDRYGEVEDKKIIKSYSDINMDNKTLSVMTLNTILANKFGLLNDLTRNEPRDLFDIWFLLNRKNKFDFDFDKVRKIYKQKYSFYPSYFALTDRMNNSVFQESWRLRLSKQVADLPTVSFVIDEIKVMLAQIISSES